MRAEYAAQSLGATGRRGLADRVLVANARRSPRLSRPLLWKRACARAGVDYIPLQQGTRHSILTMLGQTLPERVLRDFSRHRDARSLDRYSKPRATRRAIVRAFPGPSGPLQPNNAERRRPEVLRE